MERLKFITLIMALFVIVSCSEPGYEAIFHFRNESGVDIHIPKHGIYNTEMSIQNNEEYTVYYGARHFPNPFGSAKSVDVIFNGDRKITYYSRELDVFHTPMFIDNYELLSKKSGPKKAIIYEYRYTFIPEQYELAEPIEP